MALPSTIYRVNISLSDVDRGIYEALQTTVALHPSETPERLAARLLAYALFYDSELAFTKGVGAGDEPDLWLKGPDGRTLLWIEVGLPEAERLIKAARHSERVALIAIGRALSSWEQQHLPKLTGIDNLQILTFDQGFINALAATLERSITWSVTLSDNHLYINSGTETFETILHNRGR
jgi:uncharacterized protein YaeQ